MNDSILLSHNNLQTISKEIGSMNNLVELYLSNNQLTSIPVELGNLLGLVA